MSFSHLTLSMEWKTVVLSVFSMHLQPNTLGFLTQARVRPSDKAIQAFSENAKGLSCIDSTLNLPRLTHRPVILRMLSQDGEGGRGGGERGRCEGREGGPG